eukprot:TRINITY_DN45952_c0_g1_i1.p1 TRINITY_DN45952_c0_g1~~TRINITY_DN45952_c0_g1_i1.p1  ORF type:complete len:525 (-),score=80.20 TRINITY_DN45952_c0_g1_i1:205-1740(-)
MAATEMATMAEDEQLLDCDSKGIGAETNELVNCSQDLHSGQRTKFVLRIAATGLLVCLALVVVKHGFLRVGMSQLGAAAHGSADPHALGGPESVNLDKMIVKAQATAPAKSETFLLASTDQVCNVEVGKLFAGEDRACEERCRHTLGCNYYMISGDFCQLSNSCLSTTIRRNAAQYMRTDIKRVLFVGDSLTFVEYLPGQLATIAASLGHSLEVGTYFIPACTLLAQTAEYNRGVNKLMGLDDGEYEWDYIVLQEHTLLPAVKSLRDAYFTPAVSDFVRQKGSAKIVLHMTESYNTGNVGFCRPPSNAPNTTMCWPRGHIKDYLEPLCKSNTNDYLAGVPCMTYANLRGFMDTASQTGADLVSPGGIAWMIATGWSFDEELGNCKAAIDKEYNNTPLETQMGPANLDLAYLKLYMEEKSRTSRLGTLVHPSRLGQYLNALVLYATMFGSPIGSTAQPTCWSACYGDDWHKEPVGIFKSKVPVPILNKLQKLAVQTVDWFKAALLWADMSNS